MRAYFDIEYSILISAVLHHAPSGETYVHPLKSTWSSRTCLHTLNSSFSHLPLNSLGSFLFPTLHA